MSQVYRCLKLLVERYLVVFYQSSMDVEKYFLIAAAIFSIFTIVVILVSSYQIFISSRFILGIAVRIVSFIVPLYFIRNCSKRV